MKKLLKQYPAYAKTLNQDEIDYLLKQNPQKLVGGYNITGIKNTILFYHFYKNLNWESLMTKYFEQIQRTCLADKIIIFDGSIKIITSSKISV